MKYLILLEGRTMYAFDSLSEAWAQKHLLDEISPLDYSEPVEFEKEYLDDSTFSLRYLGIFKNEQRR